jgi:hypothetical protein
MKKQTKNLLMMVIAVSLFAISCTKENNTANNGTWTLGSTTYTAKTSVRESVTGTDKTLSFNDGPNNVVGFSFKSSYPTSNSSYNLFGLSGVGVIAISNSKSYGLTKETPYNNGKVATVTVSGGKIKITTPTIWLFNLSNANDSIQFSGTLTEF